MGRRAWLKAPVRDTVEVILGAVTGSRETPERLVVGLYDQTGDLVVAGGTGPLCPRQRGQVVPHLREPVVDHPWPDELPAGCSRAVARVATEASPAATVTGIRLVVSRQRSELVVRFPRGLVAGPFRTAPSGLNRDPWQGQSQLVSAAFQATWQPRCVHRVETACSAPVGSR